MAGYYYRQLDREKRAVYDAMRTGMEALAPGIRLISWIIIKHT